MNEAERLSSLRDWERFANLPCPCCTDEQAMDYDDLSDYAALSKEPDVTVIVLAYNHGKWIRDCLESLIRQKTRYTYEILVSEDGSTDDTLSICKAYRKRYPGLIRLFAARHNHGGIGNGSTGGRVERAVKGRCQFVMWCEGDDYWVDELKIEKQVSFLETHREVDACAARFNTFYVRENRMDRSQEGMAGDYVRRIFRNGFEYFHISTVCVRQCAYLKYIECSQKTSLAYDMILLLTLELGRGVYVMPEVISVYRRTGEGIWSSCSHNRMRAMHHRTLTVCAKTSAFPDSIYTYADLINGYWRYARIDFWRRREWASLVLALVRVVQYSLRSPLSVLYCGWFFAWPKIKSKVRGLI